MGVLPAVSLAQSDNPLGLYIGAAYGQGHIRAQIERLTPSGAYPIGGEFDASHSAYQAMLGIRPISFLGAEITYVDFGESSVGAPGVELPLGGGLPGSAPYPTAVQVSQEGEAAYGLLYLPVPLIDVFVKAGVSRITTDMSATYASTTGVEVVGRGLTDISFAYGAGLQWKLGDWAVRGEYERFSAAGANPSLLSLGMIYWIPWG